jgi:hypothetical protein
MAIYRGTGGFSNVTGTAEIEYVTEKSVEIQNAVAEVEQLAAEITSNTSAAQAAADTAVAASNGVQGFAAIASDKALEAQTSASSAATSANTATTQALAASTSATNAATSETNAANSATSATTSATTATTQAGIATTKALEASTSASNAASSASSASTSASTATTAASSATASATSAANSVTQIESVYVRSTTAPTDTSTLWFDLNVNKTKVYDPSSSSWVEAGSSVNGTAQRYSYTATSGQTTFTAQYDVGFVDVYRNGLKLAASDFTATNGTSVVLGVACELNDVVDIIGYGSFNVANTYTVAQTDALLADKQATLVSGTNIKTVNGSSLLGSGDLLAGVTTNYQEFTTSGTWVKPTNASFVLVELAAGGGGGGNEFSAGPAGGGGGGEGYQVILPANLFSENETVIVGAGGVGKTAGGDGGGTDGGDTSFGYLVAKGGAAGRHGLYYFSNERAFTSTITEANGASLRGVPNFTGGVGGYNGGSNTVFGGGGGGGADTNTARPFGTSEVHGDGGAASVTSGIKASNGEYPSGGGGGGSNNAGGGDGGNGRVRVWTW